MILVKIENLRPVPLSLPENEVVDTEFITAIRIGDALNLYSPNPGEGAIFRVTVVSNHVKSVE